MAEGKKKDDKKLISARIDKEVAAELEAFCKEHSLIKSAFVNKAIIEYLKQKKDDSRLF